MTQNLHDLADLLIVSADDYSAAAATSTENKKKRRDPNAPKPAASNFFLFTNSIRDEVEKAHPEASFAEKSKIYGARWQKLSEEARKVNFNCLIVREEGELERDKDDRERNRD